MKSCKHCWYSRLSFWTNPDSNIKYNIIILPLKGESNERQIRTTLSSLSSFQLHFYLDSGHLKQFKGFVRYSERGKEILVIKNLDNVTRTSRVELRTKNFKIWRMLTTGLFISEVSSYVGIKLFCSIWAITRTKLCGI